MDRARRISLLLAGVACVLALGGQASLAAPAKKPPPQTVPGELMVGFDSDVSAAEQQKILRAAGAETKKNFKPIHGALAQVPSGDVTAALERLRTDPRVRYAEPNFVVSAVAMPNDPSFSRTWGLNNTGQPVNGFPGIPDADIDAPEAWNVTAGSPAVTVAVIDTGVDMSHADLSPQIWINQGENCGGCRIDGIDNDHNGFIDDWRGWDFANNDNNPTDDQGHGTHVAGTIGAKGNNGIGVAGVTWNVRLMPVKFLNAQGSGTDAGAVGAVLYAAQNGADIMNNSWASTDYSHALADAITVADQHNSLFVAAAGNDGADNDSTPTYPASYDNPNVLSVAATDNTDNLAFFSNTGRQSVDLGAPGVDIYSTALGGGYQFLSGTSMATPHVAGAATLAKAAFPTASAVGLKTLLLSSVDPKPALASETSTGGRLNIGNAVACNSSPQVWIDSPGPGFSVDVGTPVSFSASATNCATPIGITVSASANGTPVSLTPRGDGLFTGTFTPTAGGAVTFSVTASNGVTSTTRSVTGSARKSQGITPGGPPVTVTSVTGEAVPLKFNGTAGERVSISLTNATIPIAQVSLVQPSGDAIASALAGAGAPGFVDTTTLPVTGAYTINVAPLAGAGSMTLQLYDVPPDATATTAPGGSPASVSTSTPGQNARVTFSGAAGQRIAMQISNATYSMASLSILKPDGSPLGGSRIIGPGSTFVDATALPAAGAYTILIDPNGAATGSATLTLYDVPPDAGGSITPGGPPVTVTTTAPGQNGRLTFAGTAGQRVSLKITNVTFSSASTALIAPDGSQVGGSTVLFPGGGGFLEARTLPSTGTYAITIDPPSTSTGSATFQLYDVPPDLSGTITPGGAALVATISTPGQNAKYTFDGTAGQRISLKLGPSTISMGWVSITGPSGQQIVSNTIFGNFETFIDTRTLPATGKYTLTLDPANDATGSATLTLYDVPPDAAAALTIGGPPQSISMTTPGQNGRVTFTGRAGQPVTIALTGVTVPVGFVSILKPDGTTLVSNTLMFDRTITAAPTVDGTYTIVADPQGSNTGRITFAAS